MRESSDWNDVSCSGAYYFVCQVLCCDPTLRQLAYWPFTDGTATDASGFGNDGTIYGSINYVQVFRHYKEVYAFYFDGIDDYIEIDSYDRDLDIGTSDLSISAWIRTNATGNGRIFSKGSSGCVTGYMMRTTNSNANILLELSSGDSCILQMTGTKVVNDGKWHWIVGTVENGGEAKIYVDNKLDTSTTLSGSYNLTNSRSPMIGMNDVTPIERFEGIIDDVRIYSKAMSTDDMNCLYENVKCCVFFSFHCCGAFVVSIVLFICVFGNYIGHNSNANIHPNRSTNICSN